MSVCVDLWEIAQCHRASKMLENKNENEGVAGKDTVTTVWGGGL